MNKKPHRYKKKKKPQIMPESITPQTSTKTLNKWKKSEGSEQYSEILSKLAGRELECMICMNQIGWRGKIWNCEQCRIPVHLTCIKRWKESSGLTWNCPACFFDYKNEPKYTCFCGKIENPLPGPMIPPHSCGDVCGRSRGLDCPHLCPQQCHPGACPPCTSMAPPKACYCLKTTFQSLCKDRNQGRSCDQACSKPLNCSVHQCPSQCHEGVCAPCQEVKKTDCYCGKETMSLNCANEPLCGQICGKILDCGKHFCTQICHKGKCEGCKLAPELISRCPCGKNLLEMILLNPRSSCTDPVPSCYGICDKVLICGHKCKAICHNGNCPPCKSVQEVSCRCTRTMPQVKCEDIGKPVLCGKVCGCKKSCKKHKCSEVCCPGLDDIYSDQHRCLETCGKMLNCNKHTCLSHCHIGSCEPCKVLVRSQVFCPCGKTFKDPPLRCGTSDLIINCGFKCDKTLPCGHQCQSFCHPDDHPSCSILADTLCKCQKVKLPVRCSQTEVSCGKLCSKTLKCGHLCIEKCHSGLCENYPNSHLCKIKKRNCEHTCLENCHFPKDCPESSCKVKVFLKCECGCRVVNSVCSESTKIECSDECLVIKRGRALGALEKEIYTEELVEFASINLDFVKKVEHKLETIISSKSKTTFMPPMKDKQRWLCHELASNHYKLDTESLDKEPYRSVYIHLTETARIPKPLLSEFVLLVNQGIEVEFEKKEVVASLFFYKLSGFVTNDEISEVLKKFAGQFYIKWENDHSAYVHFFSIYKCTEAEKLCKGIPGQYSVVKMIVNTPQEDTTGYKKRFRNSRKTQEVKEFDEEVKEQNNFGAVEQFYKKLSQTEEKNEKVQENVKKTEENSKIQEKPKKKKPAAQLDYSKGSIYEQLLNED